MDAETPPIHTSATTIDERENESATLTVFGRANATDEAPGPDPIDYLRPWRKMFVQSLRERPNVWDACKKARVSRASAYEARETDELFREMWNDAVEGAWDNAEGVLYEEGVDGRVEIERKVLRDGTVRETRKRVRDIRALEILLRGKRRETYAPDGQPIQVGVAVHLNELLSRIRQPGMPRIPEGQRKPKADTMLIVDADAPSAKPIKGGPGRV